MTRIVRDTMGEMEVPEGALYGAQTARALENFKISGITFPRIFIRSLGIIKETSVQVNTELGLLDPATGEAIERAAREVAEGEHDAHFPLDIFQTGSGTSTNMNANEVIAKRASDILGKEDGVHPNDHVNLCQSSNDVFPSTLHLAARMQCESELYPALRHLRHLVEVKAEEFDDIITVGRTHLQDATPVRLGQIFSGYARQTELSLQRIIAASEGLHELPLGGTAVGTGMNAHPRFASLVIGKIAEQTALPFREADNHFEAQGSRDAVVALSGSLKGAAVALFKIANDIRFLASGPRCGLGELRLPAVQPGSSIMPGKINPVMAESLMQVCAQVIGYDAAIAVGGLGGNFELNTMMPLMAHNLLQSIQILSNGLNAFTDRCVKELAADRERCSDLAERSLALATVLAPKIGYDRAAQLAKRAQEREETIRAILKESDIDDDEIAQVLDLRAMTEGGF